MKEFLVVLAIIFVVYGISFALINLRQLVTGQEFRGTCASNNPMLKDELGECTICGKKVGDSCDMPQVGDKPA